MEDLLRAGPMKWREAVAIAIGVARGLEALRARGIIHRDVKPSNVLLVAAAGERQVKIGLRAAGDGGPRVFLMPRPGATAALATCAMDALAC